MRAGADRRKARLTDERQMIDPGLVHGDINSCIVFSGERPQSDSQGLRPYETSSWTVTPLALNGAEAAAKACGPTGA